MPKNIIEKVQIQRFQNGYGVNDFSDNALAVFNSFYEVSQHVKAMFEDNSSNPRMFSNSCNQPSPEEMRDELGELRRQRDIWTKRNHDIAKRFDETVDTLNRQISYTKQLDDEIAARDDVIQKLRVRVGELPKRKKKKLPY